MRKAIIALLLACGTTFAGAPGIERSEIVVSRQICSGLFMIPLVWTSKATDRERELLAVFDTGGSSAFIDPDGLERASGSRVQPGTRVRMENVFVAGRPFSTFRPRVRDMKHLGRALGREFDVFLPFQTFDDWLLTLDYARGELRISRGALPEPDGVEVFSSRGPDMRPWLPVRVGSRTRKLLLDSGSTGTISVRSHGGLEWQKAPVPLRLSHGMSDLELLGVGRLADDVTVGPTVFENPIVALTRDTELVGAEVLRNFELTFDQANRRVRMRRVMQGPVRLEPRRGTGAVLRARPEGFEIARVVQGSPAEDAGLLEGDLVTHLDDVPVFERGCREELPQDDADQVRFTVRRAGKTLRVTVGVKVLVP